MDPIHYVPHGARWALIPSDYPTGEPGTLAYRQQMLKWIAADEHRLQNHKRRPLTIKPTDTVKQVVTRLARVLRREKLEDEYISTTSYDKEGESPAWPGAIYSEIGFRWVAVFPVTGSNEGIYIHVELIGCKAEWKKGRYNRYQIVTAKTWTWENAWQITRRCVELLGA